MSFDTFMKFGFDETLAANNIPFGVMPGFLLLTDQSPLRLLFKTVYKSKTVVRLVNIIFCLAFD